MNAIATFRLTFHVLHPSFSALEIEDVFHLPTRHSKSVSLPKKTKEGKLLGGEYKRTSVSFLLHKHPLNFNNVSVVELINKYLKSFNQNYIDKIIDTGGECNFLIGIFTSGNVVLDFDTISLYRLSRSRISVKIDIYGGED